MYIHIVYNMWKLITAFKLESEFFERLLSNVAFGSCKEHWELKVCVSFNNSQHSVASFVRFIFIVYKKRHVWPQSHVMWPTDGDTRLSRNYIYALRNDYLNFYRGTWEIWNKSNEIITK